MKSLYENPANAQYLTFGCFRRKHLFVHNALASLFTLQLAEWRKDTGIQLWAWVIMPNHIHLLVHAGDLDLGESLGALKRPFGHRALRWLEERMPATYKDLAATDHGKTAHRFWQAGGGYDRNVFTDNAVRKAMEYIHNNPVRAGLARLPEEYPWSSARFWITGEHTQLEVDVPQWWK